MADDEGSSLEKVAIARPPPDSRAAPARLLQLDLTFERFGEVNDEQLDEAAAQRDAGEHVKVPFRPDAHNLDATGRPNLLRRRRDRLRLNAVAAHDIDETWRNVRRVDAAAVRNATALHRRRRAVEVLVLRPVEEPARRQPAAVELLLHEVDEVLQVRVVPVQRDDLQSESGTVREVASRREKPKSTYAVRERILQNRVHGVRKDKRDDRHGHLAKKEDKQAQRVELQQAGVLPEGAWKLLNKMIFEVLENKILIFFTQTTAEADDEHDATRQA